MNKPRLDLSEFSEIQQQVILASASEILEEANRSPMATGGFDSGPRGVKRPLGDSLLRELAGIPDREELADPIVGLVKKEDLPSLMDSIQASGSIVFGGGVPVGGWTAISLFPNGAFNFSGHLHDSGAPSYDVGVTWVVTTSDGSPTFSLPITGRCHGTFESGSRNFDWNVSGNNPALAAAWGELSAGYRWRWNAGANIDIGSITSACVQAIGAVGAVIALL